MRKETDNLPTTLKQLTDEHIIIVNKNKTVQSKAWLMKMKVQSKIWL